MFTLIRLKIILLTKKSSNILFHYSRRRHGDLKVSALNSRSTGLGSNAGQSNCVFFFFVLPRRRKKKLQVNNATDLGHRTIKHERHTTVVIACAAVWSAITCSQKKKKKIIKNRNAHL